MRKGEPKPLNERLEELAKKRQASIEEKCHPAIFEMAQLWKGSEIARKAMGPNPPHKLIAGIQDRVEKRLTEIHRKYSGPVQPEPNRFAAQVIFSDEALKSESDGIGIAESIHFQRHKTPAKRDAEKMRAKDWKASRRIQRTIADLEQLRCGQGPIEPFKGNVEHWSMFELLWGMGLEKLTPEELAIFFDKYCPCDSETHAPDTLKKLRARFKRALFPTAPAGTKRSNDPST